MSLRNSGPWCLLALWILTAPAAAQHVLRQAPSSATPSAVLEGLATDGGWSWRPFADVQLDVRITARRAGLLADEILWGELADEATSRVLIIVHGSVLRVDVHSPSRGRFELRSGPDGHLARQVDRSADEICAGAPVLSTAGSASALASASAGDVPIIDVMLVYTPSALALEGSVAAIEATIEAHVAFTNQVYADSGALQRLRLVHAAQVAYVESGNSLTDLDRLKQPADGHMDAVHTWRDAWGADCVSLIATSGSAGVGYQMAGLNPAFEDRAFSAVGHDVGGRPFAHELGHNMGTGHNNGPGASAAAFCYSYGHRTPDDAWRTIMSSSPGVHIDVFSNPELMAGGWPLGIDGTGCPPDGADAARSLNGTAATVAAFRPTVVPLDAFVDLGAALPGTAGAPFLAGSGPLIEGTRVGISLSSARPSAFAHLVVGFSLAGVPFAGGTLLPDLTPPGFFATLFTDPTGALLIEETWPPGVPAGFGLYLQYWIVDPVGPFGFAASNGILGTAH